MKMGLTSLISQRGRATREEVEPFRQLVNFRIGEEDFGVDILSVQEIIRMPSITQVPNAPPSILGMINLRGKVLPVIDLRKRLRIRGKKSGETDRRTRVLIMEMNGNVLGFIVDAVSEVIKVPVSEIEPTPHLVVSSIAAEYIQGIVKLSGRLIILLDFQRVLKPKEKKDLESLDLGAFQGGGAAGLGVEGSGTVSHTDKH
jgi:purine-binding chemotaxis protein CheW